MRFIADLHIHSKYSMATSRDLDLEHLYKTAQEKGIGVVGTGDFTHPGWFAELKEKLVPAENGLFRLRPELEAALSKEVAGPCRQDVRFMLSAEISSIYKKAGKVRKNHNLVYMPDLASAERFNARLDAIGNIKSDGRPILGLDARDLLEILLETDDRGYLVPAHIWTPWFSLFGSKSGFDRLEDCFGDLTPHIFAAETGLSSDPAMNWTVSQLKGISLISNSDAHSPGKLGREANIFETDLDYFAIRQALETGDTDAFIGTYEFYPEEGKYHLDGHRKCGVRFSPEESKKHDGICPECGKPLTLGVMYRVSELADQTEEAGREGRPGYRSIVPLVDILSEVLRVGPNTKKVKGALSAIQESVGSEFHTLWDAPVDALDRSGIPLLGEAITRMREDRIRIEGGYDGEFGVVKIFHDEERDRLLSGSSLFAMPGKRSVRKRKKAAAKPAPGESKAEPEPAAEPVPFSSEDPLSGLNPEQLLAASQTGSPCIIVAGPGTGKTRTLTCKMAHLVKKGTPSEAMLAVTFTKKAAAEMKERLEIMTEGFSGDILTFHALGHEILKSAGIRLDIATEADLEKFAKAACTELGLSGRGATKALRTEVSRIKRKKGGGEDLTDAEISCFLAYQVRLEEAGRIDFDDLLRLSVELIKEDADLCARWQTRYRAVFMDEFQDVDAVQYRLVRLLFGEMSEITLIGDPDQSIYGFRGASPVFFEKVTEDWEGVNVHRLVRNYRSSSNILDAAEEIIQRSDTHHPYQRAVSTRNGVTVAFHPLATDLIEAEWIADRITRDIGGMNHMAIYAGKDEGKERGFGDFAVLMRTRAQSAILAKVFDKRGIPFSVSHETPLFEDPVIQESLGCLRLLVEGHFDGVSEEIRTLFAECKNSDSGASRFVEGAAERLELGLTAESRRKVASLSSLMTGLPVTADLSEFFLGTDGDLVARQAERVRILTLHASKGLEFPVVFIAGCETGFLPHETGVSEEEERRLFFVGLTRAGEELVLTHAGKRILHGKTLERTPSPFLSELSEHLEAVKEKRKKRLEKPVDDRQLGLFG